MAALILISLILSLSSLVASSQNGSPLFPCLEEGCANISVYLGPRWGTQVIYLPNSNTTNNKTVKEYEGSRKENQDKTFIKFEFKDPFNARKNISDEINLGPKDTLTEVNRFDYESEGRAVYKTNYVKDNKIRYRSNPKRPDYVPTIFHYVHGSERSEEHPKESYHGEKWIGTHESEVNDLTLGDLDLTGRYLAGVDVQTRLNMLSVEDRSKLRRLFLNYNNISALPQQMFPVELEYGLQVLWMRGNPLFWGSITVELSRLKTLKKLCLAGTGLDYVGNLYLPSLELLDVRDNMISHLPGGLMFLTNLTELNLGNNRLTYISADSPLHYMRNLRVLFLDNNRISYIDNTAFLPLQSLQMLSLTNNSLSDASFLDSVTTSTGLFLNQNPWRCSCSMMSANAKDRSVNVFDLDTLLCTDDHNLQRWVSSLTRNDVSVGCPGDGWQWLRARVGHLADLQRQFYSKVHRHISDAWLLLAVVAAVIISYVLLGYRKKGKPSTPQYNNLDDSMLQA